MRRLILICPALVILLLSCRKEHVVFQKEFQFPDSPWSYGTHYDFEFTITDTSRLYQLDLTIGHSTSYAWENLYTAIETTFPGDSTRRDIISFELATSTGEWVGRCHSGRCLFRLPLQEHVRFPAPGRYVISFEQYMREDPIKGITSLGLKVVEPLH